MKHVILYRYSGEQGEVVISPEMTDTECSMLHRLIADDGCVLTDGDVICECIDTDDPDNWTETPNENQYAEAGKILMGVSK